MKIWKVESYKASNELQLANILNNLQSAHKSIKEIIYNSKYDEYEIIYTIEDITGEEE